MHFSFMTGVDQNGASTSEVKYLGKVTSLALRVTSLMAHGTGGAVRRGKRKIPRRPGTLTLVY